MLKWLVRLLHTIERWVHPRQTVPNSYHRSNLHGRHRLNRPRLAIFLPPVVWNLAAIFHPFLRSSVELATARHPA